MNNIIGYYIKYFCHTIGIRYSLIRISLFIVIESNVDEVLSMRNALILYDALVLLSATIGKIFKIISISFEIFQRSSGDTYCLVKNLYRFQISAGL